jgi:hypothetical protein
MVCVLGLDLQSIHQHMIQLVGGHPPSSLCAFDCFILKGFGHCTHLVMLWKPNLKLQEMYLVIL